jgi:hypothetical protein
MGMYPGGNVIRVTPTLSTSAYTAHDVLFDATAIPNVVASRGGISKLINITIHTDLTTDFDLDLVFMETQTNLGTINEDAGSGSLWTDALARASKILGVVNFNMGNGIVDLVNNEIVTYTGNATGTDGEVFNQLPMLLKAEDGETSVYVAGMIRGAGPTFGADDLQFIFHVEYLG